MKHSDVIARISYDRDTGIFTRKVASSRMKAGSECSATNSKGYVEFNILGKLVRAHRLAFFIINGEWPLLTVDHINGDKQDNRWSNLREVDNKTNCENKRSINSNNSTGYTGVIRRRKKFECRIRTDGKLLYLGVFDTPQEAAAAYLVAKEKHHKGYIA